MVKPNAVAKCSSSPLFMVFMPVLMLVKAVLHQQVCVCLDPAVFFLQDGNQSHLVSLDYTAEKSPCSHFEVVKMAEGPFIHSNQFSLEGPLNLQTKE